MSLITVLRGRNVGILTAGLFLVCVIFFGGFFIVRNLHILTYDRLVQKFIPGVHGVVLVVPESTTRPTFDPWQPLEQNRSLDEMLIRLCREATMPDTCAMEPGVRFELFTKGHRVGTEFENVALVRGTIPLTSGDITSQLLDERLSLMRDWALANQRSDGSYQYLYHPSSGSYPEGSNVIREMITVQGLYALGNLLNDAELIKAARAAEKQALFAYYRFDATKVYGYMVEADGEVKLGATGLAVLALREGKSDDEFLDAREKALGSFLLSMQRDDGSFQTFLHDAATDENERFYSGEALTAIAVLARVSGETKYYDALNQSLPYYRVKLADDFYPQYAPWHMQAYTIAYKNTQNEAYAEYVYWLADKLIETMLAEDYAALPDEEGRFSNAMHPEWGPPHSSSTGIYTEGLTYALELAQLRGDSERIEQYQKAVLSGTRSLLHVQWTPESAYYLKYPERTVGAFKRTVTDNRHRIDQLGHALNALTRVREFAF